MPRFVLSAVLVAVLLGTACSKNDAAPAASGDPTLPPGIVLPPLVIAGGSDVFRYGDGELKKVGSVKGEARRAVGAKTGSIFVQREFGTEDEPRSEIVKIKGADAEKVKTTDASQIHLYEYVDKDTLLFATENPDSEDEIKGHVWLGSERVADAYGPEFFTSSASYAAKVVIVSTLCDLTECMAFFTADGNQIEDRADPTDDLEYNAQPLVTSAVLSPDAKRLAYLEGPDVAGDSPDAPAGDWELVVVDQPKGRELFRHRVGAKDLNVSWLDYDGRWAIVSAPSGIYAIDTREKQPAVLRIPGVRGLATIAA